MARAVYREGDIIVVPETDLRIESPDPEVTYTLRPIPRDVYRRVIAQCSDKRTKTIDPAGSVDIQWALFDYALVDWTGIVDVAGAPLPCTEDTKKAFASDFNIVAELVGRAGGTRHAADEAARGASFRPTP